MKRLEAGIKLLLGLLGVAVTASWMQQPVDMSLSERMELREEVLRAYSHAYGSYMAYAYPADELMPLSCKGRRWERRTRGTIDDALGGYALTMVDSLDMHAVVGDGAAFREAVGTLLRDFESGVLTFDRDVTVSVFEASIRVLGGLLSAHQIAIHLAPGERLGPTGWYRGGLLALARDLGERLLPAFATPLGIPVHRVNLRKGIPRGETQDTCSAAAGTFLVEFGALSRLTGDPSFEVAARRAVRALWERRSPLGLVGGGVRGASGTWQSPHAGIGAGTDSFYEYLHKSAELLGDAEMGGMFLEAYGAVEEHLVWRGWHVEVDMSRGLKAPPLSHRVSALQAFWPALQAAAGDLAAAERTYRLLFELWEEHEALPDFYDVFAQRLLHYGRDSPLRPELAESTLALYRATGATEYLRAGKELLGALRRSRVKCGYASVGDVVSGHLEDRMDSYFIAETLKYLFLLFDSSLPSEKRKSIFCTPEQEAEAAEHARHAHAASARAAAARNTTALASNSSSSSASSIAVKAGVAGDPVDGRKAEQKRVAGKSERARRGGGKNNSPPPPPPPSPPPPQCLLWADTVLSTEGHPFLASLMADADSFGATGAGSCRTIDEGGCGVTDPAADLGRVGPLGSSVEGERLAGVVSSADGELSLIGRALAALRLRGRRAPGFRPWRHFARAVDSRGFEKGPANAEVDVQCHKVDGRCRFYDIGPRFLAHVREAAGDEWALALVDVCDWVRDTVFSPGVISNAIEGESVTYRLHQISTTRAD